jgi:hypothetical protein
MGWRRVVVVFVGLSGACASAQTLPWPVDQAPQTGAQPSGPSGTQQTLCTLEITRLNQNVEALRTAARTASERCNLSGDAIQQIKNVGQQAVGACRQVCVLEPAAGRLDDVPPLFATPIRLAQSGCGDR